LAASGKAEAGGPESAAGGVVVGGLVEAAALGLAGGPAGLGGVAAGVGVEGLGAGWEAVAVTVAVTEAVALGDAPVFALFGEQAPASSATTASTTSRRGDRTILNGREVAGRAPPRHLLRRLVGAKGRDT
jgi:hypothetical protein